MNSKRAKALVALTVGIGAFSFGGASASAIDPVAGCGAGYELLTVTETQNKIDKRPYVDAGTWDQVLDAVRLAVEVGQKKAVAYPNGGGDWDAEARAWVGTPGVDADLARSWADAGTAYLGGCCRVGPSDIQRLVAALDG